MQKSRIAHHADIAPRCHQRHAMIGRVLKTPIMPRRTQAQSDGYSAPMRLLGRKAQTVPTTERIVEIVMRT